MHGAGCFCGERELQHFDECCCRAIAGGGVGRLRVPECDTSGVSLFVNSYLNLLFNNEWFYFFYLAKVDFSLFSEDN